MALRLEIDVFSGRPNPVVEINDRTAARLLERLGPGRVLDHDEGGPGAPPLLGYRGVVLEQLDRAREDLPTRIRIVNGSAFGRGLAHELADPDLEEELLSPRLLEEAARNLVDSGVDDGANELVERVPRLRAELRELQWWKIPGWWGEIVWPWPKPCRCAPEYEPGWWNVPVRQPYNNCYNYATNYRTNTFAQPGKAAGAQYTSLNCASVRPAAIADELIDVPQADNICPSEGHLVALVVAPGWDYHWYRKDKTGWWSHKPGGTAATNLDNAGKLISDPRNAARGPYTDFCTFMIVKHGHIRIT
jgi:hypothetical protein